MGKTTTVLRPSVIAIGGSDCSGMAGVHRDAMTIAAMGAHPQIVSTANTAQNAKGLRHIHPVADDIFERVLETVFEGVNTPYIKIGLLVSVAHIARLTDSIKTATSSGAVVLDPVLSASSGEALNSSAILPAIIDSLLPHCDLVTPNLAEAEQLAGMSIRCRDDIAVAAKKIVARGAKAVFVKGGHHVEFLDEKTSGERKAVELDGTVSDYFYSPRKDFWLSSKKIKTDNLRGTGCALASAITSSLALGYSIEDAVVIGKMAINQGLENAYGIAGQHGPVNIQHFPDALTHLPDFYLDIAAYESAMPTTSRDAFLPPTIPGNDYLGSGAYPLGLYPVVDSAAWIARLLALGVTTIQLRVKEGSDAQIEQEIISSIRIAEKYSARLFINDYWSLAIKHRAYGVHLGQEDLDLADIAAIRSAGLRLGVSTHCHYEVARAHALRPSYIACGPVYHTNTKQMPWTPHGPEGFAYWRRCLDEYPLVAIGGINQARIAPIKAAGADGIAMITAITLAQDPEQSTRAFMAEISDQ